MTKPLPRIVQMLKAIGHPARLRLLTMLRDGPLCVCQMTVVLKLAASTVSEHLSELRKAGVVSEKKTGRWVAYSLSADPTAQAILNAGWLEIETDPEARADAIVVSALRRVPVDELCNAGLDLSKLARPHVNSAIERASRLRGES